MCDQKITAAAAKNSGGIVIAQVRSGVGNVLFGFKIRFLSCPSSYVVPFTFASIALPTSSSSFV